MSVSSFSHGRAARLHGRRSGLVAIASVAALLSLLLGFGGCGLPTTGTAGTGTTQPCSEAAHCDDGNPCTLDACGADGMCTVTAGADGPAPLQVSGDCRVIACVAGAPVEEPSETDHLDDGNECTLDACVEGTSRSDPRPDGTPCAMGAVQGQCQAGACTVPCDAEQSCDDDNPCTDEACDAATGACVYTQRHGEAPAGHVEDEHDCGITLCVQGQTEVIAVPTETPVPSSECMAGICMGTMPSEVPLGAGAECGVAGVCDGAGVCGECNFAVDCVALPPDDECQARTCLNNVCGQSFTASGTPLAAQVDGDCRTVVCNGSGGTAIQNDDADLIDDGNECTSQSCENGVALTENVVADTPCGTAEQTVCNGQGACVGCTMATQCGEPTFCGTPVCGSDQECGWEYTTSGTPLEDEDQVPGDCKRLQCSGTSEVPVTVTFGSDVPADDGEQCTVEACNGDAPVHLPAAANSACAQDGGLFCDGAGACVECLAESQCPPWTNDCAMPTCEMNACGFDYAPDGTALVDDVPGDCRRRECDGAGGIELEPFAMDPYDDGNECTADTCENGTPSNQAVADGTACTQNGGQVCMGGVCRRAAGSTCATAIECASGFCADGRCCESACTGNCVSCANPTGTCANVPVGEPDTCAAGSVCNAAGVCQEENGQTCTDGDECLSGNCVDGRCCESACTGDCVSCANPTGTCANVDAGEPDTCGAGSVCNAMGVCQEENGQTCTDGDECLSGNCVDGVCCESACTGDCVSCANPTGTCANVDAGEQDTCADGSACDGAGACQEVNGQACTGEDECLSGFCVDGVCCDSTCEGACQACDAPGAEGTCGDDPLAEGEPDTCGGVGEVCSDGACIEVFGVDCDGDEDCAGASCTDGVCCSSTCTEACHACDVVGYEGTCSPEPLLVGSQDSCPDPQVCNLEGACE